LAKPGIGNANGNEPLGMGGNVIEKDIPAWMQNGPKLRSIIFCR